MLKSLLASLTGFASDKAVMEAAFALARGSHAHVQALHLRVDAQALAALVSTIHPHPLGGARRLAQDIAHDQQKLSQSAMAVYANACAAQRKSRSAKNRKSPAAGYLEVTALEDPTPRWARFHDLTIAARVPELAAGRLGDLVMQTGKPVLIPPAKPATVIGKTVVVAWKDAPEAARAVTAALPILAQAGRVIVACIAEGGDAEPQKWSATGLVAQLKRHGIAAQLNVMAAGRSPAAEKIKEIAYGAGADLIVMGAYGHSRTREWLLGGMTRSLLADCDVCVLMIH